MKAIRGPAGIVWAGSVLALALCGGPAGDAAAQDVEALIRESGAQRVSFRFATWADLQGCGRGWTRRGSDERRPADRECWSGPAEVRLDLDGGAVRRIRADIVRAGSDPDAGWRYLGMVPPDRAADYLLGLAERGDPEVGEDAVGFAALADGVETWPRMLQIARRGSLDPEVRQAATFWVGQASADEVLDGLRALVDDADSDVRQTALFVLSERQGEQAIPLLMEIAEGDADPDVRRAAFFWLSRRDDPQVLAFFERILRGSGR